MPPYEALSAEKRAVLAYARKRPELRHRELAWRMIDEDVAFLSPSTVYRILKGADLVCPWRRRAKRKKAGPERATRPDQRWSTDLIATGGGRQGLLYLVRVPGQVLAVHRAHHELPLGERTA